VRTSGVGNGASRDFFRVQGAHRVPFRCSQSGACSNGLQNRSRWVRVFRCFLFRYWNAILVFSVLEFSIVLFFF